MGSLSGAVALIVGAIVSVFGLVAGPLAGSASAATTGASVYTAITPFRVSGTTAAGVSLAANTSETVQITGAGTPAIPAGATAAVLNVTAQNPTAAGYVSVTPAGTTPTTSNVNFVAGQTVANLVTVPLSAAGAVSVYNYTGTTAVDVDVEGYYTPSTAATGTGLYNPVTPSRVFGGATTGTAIGAGVTTSATVVGGTTGVPTTASAVVVNLTAAGGTAASYLTAYPAGATPNVTSNLNFVAGQTIANRDIVNIGAGGAIDLFNYAGSVNVDVDVEGYYTGAGGAGSAFVPLATPVRVTDTRTPLNGTPIASGGTETFNLTTAASGIPATASSVAANFTVVPGAAPGYITVFPTGVVFPPTASDVNWAAGEGPVANYTQADTAGTTAGSVQVYNLNSGSSVNLVIDAFGYFAPTTTSSTNNSTVNIAIPGSTVNTISVPAAGGGVTDAPSVTATVTFGTGGPVEVGDTVLFTVSPGAGCGLLSTTQIAGSGTNPATAVTGATGVTSTLYYIPPSYVAGATASTCTISGKDGDNGVTNTAVINQTEPANTVGLVAAPGAIPANGAATSTITATVGNTIVPAEAFADTVTFSTAGTCGTLSTASGSTGPTNAITPATTYTASSTPGFCAVTAKEANSGTSATTLIDQTQSPAPLPGTVTVSGAGVGGAVPSFTSTQTIGTSTTYTALVKDASSNIVVGDPVIFSVAPGTAGETCGTLSTPASTTGSSGIATVTYTAATPAVGTVVSPTCVITILEADSASGSQLTVTQAGLAPVVSVTPTTSNDALGTADPINVSVSNVTSADNGATVTFSITAIAGATCAAATVPASTTLTVATGASTGTAATTYTAPSNAGFCTVTAAVGAPLSISGSTTIDQI